MKKIYALVMILLCSLNAMATDFYWVGGNGNWSDFQHHWALSSGGSVFQTTVPSAFDNVYFDGNSFPDANDTMVTINTAVASTKNIAFNTDQKNIKVLFNANTLIQVYGSAIFSDKLLLLNQPRIFFKSTATGNQITFNKAQWTDANIIFDGIGGSWNVTDSLTAARVISLVNGELNTTNKKVTCYSFDSNNSNNRTWKFSNAKLYIQNLNINTDNLTQIYSGSCMHNSRIYNYGLSKLNIDTLYVFDKYGSSMKNVSIKTIYGGIIFIQNALVDNIYLENGEISIQTSTVNKLYINSGVMTIETGLAVVHEAHLTDITYIKISGTFELENFTLTGNTCAKRIQWIGSDVGLLKKTSGSFTFQDALISKLTVSGGAVFNTSNSYDLGENTGINFNAPVSKTYYWVGDDGDVKDPLHWSLTSGGTPDGCVPTTYDDVILDHNSFNNGTSHFFPLITCQTINTVDLDEQVSARNMVVAGSAYLSPLFRLYEKANFYSNLPGNKIDLNGATITGELSEILFNGEGDWTLLDSLYAHNILQNSGSLYSQGWNIHANGMLQAGGNADFSHSTIVIDDGMSTNAILNTSKIIFPKGGALNSNQRVGEVISYLKTFRVSGTLTKLTSHSDLILQQTLEIDTLLLEQGITVSFSLFYDQIELQVDSIATLPSNLGCGRLTVFQTVDGNGYGSANIKKTSGTLTVTNTALMNIHATGGANFVADQCADLGNNAGWTFHALTPKTYYWINNGGQWEDPAHWSLSSGGASAGCVPAIQDKVVLDNQSFDQPNQLISKINSEVQLSGFVVQNIPPGTALAIDKYEIYGNVEFTPNLHTNSCYLSIKGKKTTLKTNGKFLNQVNTATDSLELLDDLYCEGLNATRGFVKLKGHNLTTEGIAFNGLHADTLVVDMEECKIISHTIFIRLDRLNMKAAESNILLAVGKSNDPSVFKILSYDFSSAPLQLNKVEIYQDRAMPNTSFIDISFDNTIINELQIDTSELSVLFNLNSSEIKNLYMKPNCVVSSNSGKIGLAQFYGNVQMYGASHIDYLRLAPGTQLSIRSGDSIIIHEYLDAIGNSSFPITIDAITNGNKAFVKCLSGNICCSYLNLSNIAATGSANFYAGLSSNNVYNNSGWDFASNCDVLNIEAKLPGCEGKALELNTVHPVSITGFLWSGPNNFVSNAENIHIASLTNNQTGVYTLQAGGQTRKIFVTQEAKQDSVIVNYNNNAIRFRNNIINTMLGYSVSWYKDDQLIDGEFSSSISSYGEGTYYARYITAAGCNFQSNSIIVTSTTPTDFLYAPYNLTASFDSYGKVLLNWSDINTTENGFKIFRSFSPGNGFILIGTTGSSTLTYTDPTNLSAGTYYYKVHSYEGSGPSPILSDFSNLASISITVLATQSSIEQNNISIRPIPVQDFLTVESTGKSLTHVTVYDQLGVMHVNQSIDQLLSIQIDVTQLPQGVYILKVNTTGGESYNRFVK